MSLEVLKGVEEVGGFRVVDMDYLREKYPEKFHPTGSMIPEIFEAEIRPNSFIYIRRDVSSVSFTIQNGPVKECGVNGCQAVTMIEMAKLMIEGLNKNFPCRENAVTITKLDEAIMWQEKRTKDRQKRGVEGTGQK